MQYLYLYALYTHDKNFPLCTYRIKKQAGVTPTTNLFHDHGMVVHHQVHVVVHVVLVVDLLAHRETLRVVRLRAARLFRRKREHMDRTTDWTAVRFVA